MGGKPRKKGWLVKACRYDSHGIAIYPLNASVQEYPHDYVMFFTRLEWQRMGGSLPPKNVTDAEYSLVRIRVDKEE